MTVDYRITPRAYHDLLGIARYTLREWGREQRDVYMRELDKRFAWLSQRHVPAGIGRISKQATTAFHRDRIWCSI